jgi:hypothetical protein
VNDLQLLTGPAVADIDGSGGEEVLTGSASQDLVAYGPGGTPVGGWPKLTTDWTVATPLIGSFGTEDTKRSARKVVVGITRSGYVHAYRTDAPACSPSSSPRFHHDNANSGDYSRDAILPGAPTAIGTAKHGTRVRFGAPGDDLLCGTADHYELVTAGSPIDESSFADAKPLTGAPEPAAAGKTQTLDVPKASKGYLAIRAVDEQGNVGRVASVKAKAPRPGGRCEAGRLAASRHHPLRDPRALFDVRRRDHPRPRPEGRLRHRRSEGGRLRLRPRRARRGAAQPPSRGQLRGTRRRGGRATA